ncbi:hypothetical protein BH18ACI3_BH18ACI3_08840 [soil metagenome]
MGGFFYLKQFQHSNFVIEFVSGNVTLENLII